MLCFECECEARFDSPRALCSVHWVDWMYEGEDLNDPEVASSRRELLEECLQEDAVADALVQAQQQAWSLQARALRS